jgi:predicted membrane protein
MSADSPVRSEAADNPVGTALHLPSLAVALLLMGVGTLYPPLLVNSAGHADHALASAVFWAMSAGFVRGVGFVPRAWWWRVLFSGWSCAFALALAVALKWLG